MPHQMGHRRRRVTPTLWRQPIHFEVRHRELEERQRVIRQADTMRLVAIRSEQHAINIEEDLQGLGTIKPASSRPDGYRAKTLMLKAPPLFFLALTFAACATPTNNPSNPASSPASSDTPLGHRVLTQGNNQLCIINRDGEIEWRKEWGGIHDVHVLPNGNIMVKQGAAKVVEIDRQTQQVIWQYDSSKQNGNVGQRVEVHAFQPLPNGNIMIAESGPARILEVDRTGKLQLETKLKVDRPHPHTDTRLVRKLSNGHYLVCHEGDGFVREYEPGSGKVVWEYDVPMFAGEAKGGHGPEAFGDKCFAAVRLANGNTLIATGNGHSVIEVTRDQQLVWQLSQDELPGIRLAWVTTLEVLPNGNYMIGNCHAGKGQPLLVEVVPQTKQVVWQLDQFELLGNSVSNSVLLDGTNNLR